MKNKVVITGLGVTSPIGLSVGESVDALADKASGVRFMPEWDHIVDLQGRIGATVEGVDLEARYPRKKRRTMGRVALLALHATEQAVAQAGLDEEVLQGGRLGVAYGSTTGSSGEQAKFFTPIALEGSMRGLQANAYLRIMAHTCAANLAHYYGITGRIAPTCSACTSSSQAIGTAYELIKHGLQEVMICGGAEEMHFTTAVTFDLLMATSTKHNDDPTRSPRPFDANRDGLVIGEGAGTVILESLEHARERGATILGEVRGFANNCDSHHFTNPSRDGMRRVMELALEDAQVSRDDVAYVNAHGTATPVGDLAESNATFDVFERAVPCSSFKGNVGHTLGACGAIEVAWTLEMMRRSVLLPTRNLDQVDPACGALGYVREVQDARIPIAMSNNFAFGGVNTSIVLSIV